MVASFLDNEFLHYWSKLTVVQKESLLNVIKSFAPSAERISVEQYNTEINEAVVRVQNGEFYTQEEVEKM